MRSSKILLLAALMSVGTFCHAQETLASIAGTVTDAATKKPLIEAVITLSSPEFEGKRLAITDSSGSYKVPNLPAGIYTMVFEMEGYSRFTKDNVRVSKGLPMSVSLEMTKVNPGGNTALSSVGRFETKLKLMRATYTR